MLRDGWGDLDLTLKPRMADDDTPDQAAARDQMEHSLPILMPKALFYASSITQDHENDKPTEKNDTNLEFAVDQRELEIQAAQRARGAQDSKATSNI